jgi:hypothetical protein
MWQQRQVLLADMPVDQLSLGWHHSTLARQHCLLGRANLNVQQGPHLNRHPSTQDITWWSIVKQCSKNPVLASMAIMPHKMPHRFNMLVTEALDIPVTHCYDLVQEGGTMLIPAVDLLEGGRLPFNTSKLCTSSRLPYMRQKGPRKHDKPAFTNTVPQVPHCRPNSDNSIPIFLLALVVLLLHFATNHVEDTDELHILFLLISILIVHPSHHSWHPLYHTQDTMPINYSLPSRPNPTASPVENHHRLVESVEKHHLSWPVQVMTDISQTYNVKDAGRHNCFPSNWKSR